MKVVIFCHSLRSDWNHGNAHFLRGICRELQGRGCELAVHEPRAGWSAAHLREQGGAAALAAWQEAYPELASTCYDDPATVPLDPLLADADVVLVHEWTDPVLVARIGRHRARHPHYRLFFHDTHHRSLSAPAEIDALELEHYDGV
ncbi:MAG: glycosyltransferase, partial [Planctomycetota bacterium]